MKWCIGIPTLNRADLLEESVVDLRERCLACRIDAALNGKDEP